MTTETLIWFGIVLVIGGIVWIAEPYHTRLIEAAHARDKARDEEHK
jgi:hypothetical protein